MISMIAAIGEGNRVLGRNNKLLWNIPEDTKFFRDMTRGHPVIMGRKTFESMGKSLPQRINIVITRDKDWKAEGVIICYSMEEAIGQAKNFTPHPNPLPQAEREIIASEAFIIGGGQIYTEGLKFSNRLYLTIVHNHFDGDAYFPEYEKVFTRVISERESQGNGYRYTFLTLEKN